MAVLVQVAIGPVQSFIVAARKTRDLAAGSQLLQDLVTRCAQAIAQWDPKAEWIIPHDPTVPAANIILFKTSQSPAELDGIVRQSVQSLLTEQWKSAAREYGDYLRLDAEKLAMSQIEAFPEVFVAWHSMEPGFEDARRGLADAMAARKSLREFRQSATSEGIQKSPLLPQFECVLKLDGSFALPEKLQKRKLFRSRESLDAISLIKRSYLRKETPSTRDFAAESFLARLESDQREEIESRLKSVFGKSEDSDLHGGLGDLLFNDFDADLGDLEGIGELRSELLGLLGLRDVQPGGYYAVLKADGDSMGKWLSEHSGEEKHRDLAKTLHEEFAKKVEKVVEESRGLLVFAGGDDVLALLPADTCLNCAHKLQALFANVPSSIGGTLTLSVGVSLVHYLSDLREAVDSAESMLKQAKQVDGKNSLAISFVVRSGGARSFVSSWNNDPTAIIGECVQAFKHRKVPRGFAHEIGALADRLEAVEGMTKEDVALEYHRVRKRKEPVPPADLGAQMVSEGITGLRQFSSALMLAQVFTRSGMAEDKNLVGAEKS